jgi:hypothetical protein
MTAQGEKEQILKKDGYVYNFDHAMYFNRKAKKIFSMDFIEDDSVSVQDIEERVREANSGTGWQIYFVGDLPDSVRRQVEASLG